MAAALSAQVRQRRLRDPQRAEDVRLDLRARFVLGDLFEHSELSVAGVVDDDVEPPEMVVGRLHRGEIGVTIRHVECQREQRITELGGEVVQRGHVAGGSGHLIAALQGRDRPFATEAA